MQTREEFETTYGPVSDAVFTLFLQMQAHSAALQEQIIALTALVKALQDRLNQDSHNSNKPPSSDGFKKKPVTLRAKSGRKSGGQKGHPGRSLAFCDTPKHTLVHTPSSCSHCGTDLEAVSALLKEKRQVFDIPPIQLECSEHQAHAKSCPHCGEITVAPFPEGVENTVQYGPRLTATLLYWTSYQMVPTGRTREMAADLFGASLSEATLYTILNRASDTLAPVETEIKQALSRKSVTHHDETGARVAGSLHWVHVVCTALLTLYFRHKSRGKKAMEAMGVLGKRLGTAMHDGWKPYFRYGGKHALCNAHHLRELLALFEQEGQQWAKDMIGVLMDAKAAVEKAVQSGRAWVHPLLLCRLEKRYKEALAAGYRANPLAEATPSRGPTKRSTGGNLVRRLDIYQQETLAFLYDFDVPFDNNQAERDVRMIKVKLKVSGCFRTDEGADAFCRIRGYLSTMRKQGHNVMAVLRSVCDGVPTRPDLDTP
jgi:transposase